MLFRSGFRLALTLAAAAGLLAGCRHSVPTPKAAGGKSPVISTRAQPFNEQERIEAHAHYATALVHELNGDAEGALTDFYEAAIRDLDNEGLIMEVSRRLIQARQTEKALDLVSRACARPSATGNLFARLGFIHFQMGKPEEAIRANRTAIRRDPRSLVGYQNLFLIHLQTKRLPEALKILEEASRVGRTEPEFLVGLGELYGNFGLQNPTQRTVAFERGVAVLERAAAQKPAEPQVRLRLADGFSLLGRPDDAAREYEALLKDLPDLPYLREGVRAKLADIYLRGRDTKQATTQLETLIRDNPTDAQAHYWLGTIAAGETNYTKAIDAFSRVVLLNPTLEQPYYDLAIAQINNDQVDEALKTLETARQKFPNRFLGEYLAGLAYGQEEQYTNALKHFTAAEIIAQAAVQSEAPIANQLLESLLFQLGATHERLGDYAQAEKHFEKCLDLFPNNDEAQNYLGFMWADRGEKLDRAKILIEKALTADPNNAAYLDSMGWVLFRMHQPKEALEFLLRAVQHSEEEDATVYDHLGDVYAALNEREKARDAWARSLTVESNDVVRRKLDAAAR
jgi:tetratricopeptide (TPR) repeat protein